MTDHRDVGLGTDQRCITAGLTFLHRLTAALCTVRVERGACGIRLVCKLLKLTGLASSFEAQRRLHVSVQERIIQHAQSERARLSASMPRRDITVAQDETFTGGLTLVAIEPERGFILLEEAATGA